MAARGSEGMGGLTCYPVFKNKEGALQVLGMPVTLLVIVILGSAVVGLAIRLWLGLALGAVAMTVVYGVFAGKPQHWVTYGLIYIYRGRSVLSPGARTSGIWEDRLRVLEELHEDF